MKGRARLGSLLMFGLWLAPALAAQAPGSTENRAAAIFSMDKDREPLVSLDGQWRFHPGDDVHWADPSFDDSAWPLISSTQGWSEQGYKNMSGLAWYRTRILIPAGSRPLALYLPEIYTSYQVFADGEMIGGLGGLPPNAHRYQHLARTFQLPENVTNHAHAALVAIRVWHWPAWARYTSGGMRGGALIGQTSLIDHISAWKVDESEHELHSSIIMAVLDALAGITALALFAFRPREKEYLWFCAALFVMAALGVFNIAINFHPVLLAVRDNAQTFGDYGAQFLFLGFYYHLLKGRRGWFLSFAVGALAADAFLWVPAYLASPVRAWPVSVATLVTLSYLFSVPATLWVDILIVRRAIEGFRDSRLVLVPQLTIDLWTLALAAIAVANRLGVFSGNEARIDHIWQHPFSISISDLLSFFFLLAMLAILIRRFALTSRHEERMTHELEAARAVQQVLIPEDIPAVPGFRIEGVYQPASEVGGDFFQILPVARDGVLIVIGDVSGKGMPAAMTVSLLVGTVRTLVHYTESPGEILAAINQRMMGRSGGGFTTCLIVHIDSSGELVAANAGHLAPYLDGEELQINPGLPLGLAADSLYVETRSRIERGSQLTFMTDGVVEAQSKTGELFGFVRAAQISTQAAEMIARAAQQFGQEDDITVLTLSTVSAPVLPAARA